MLGMIVPAGLSTATQKVDTFKRRFWRDDVRAASVYFIQRHDRVEVTASGSYQELCREVLGPDEGKGHGLPSYVIWHDVSVEDRQRVLDAMVSFRLNAE